MLPLWYVCVQMFSLEMVTTQVVARQLYRTFLEGVRLSDIGRKAEVRNVPHLARKV